jgi:hypothetical protein
MANGEWKKIANDEWRMVKKASGEWRVVKNGE